MPFTVRKNLERGAIHRAPREFRSFSTLKFAVLVFHEMKAEFVLTAANYFEVAEKGLETQSRTLATTAAFSGLGMFLLGYFLLRFWPDWAPRVGFISLMFGLLLAFVAAVLAFFPRRVKSKKSEALLRSEYERFFSDRRTFEFDEIGWRHGSERGEDARKWSELTSLRDSSNMIVLGTSGSAYLLPKSAFTVEELERIKDLSGKALDAGSLFKVNILSSAPDYVLSMLSYNWRTRWKTALLSYVAALVVLIAVTYPSAEYFVTNHPAIVVFVFVVCFLGECLYYLYLYHQAFRGNAPTDAAIMTDRIGFWAPSGRWAVKYQWFSEIRETRSLFHLYFRPESFYIIPKKRFDPEQLARFRELLHSPKSAAEGSR